MRARERNQDQDPLSACSLPQMAKMAEAGQVSGQEPGASSEFPTWVQGLRDLGHPLTFFQVHCQGAGVEVKWLGLKPVSICDASTAGCSVAPCDSNNTC